MGDKKVDRRVQRTKRVLRNSIIMLLSKEKINKITVSQLCELSDINRSTFYSYYNDVYDLLDKIKNELMEDLQNSLDKDLSIKRLLIEVLKNIYNNKDLYTIIMKNDDTEFFKEIISFTYKKRISQLKGIYPNIPDYKLDYIFTFIISGSIAIIKNWIETGMIENINDIASIIEELDVTVIKGFQN